LRLWAAAGCSGGGGFVVESGFSSWWGAVNTKWYFRGRRKGDERCDDYVVKCIICGDGEMLDELKRFGKVLDVAMLLFFQLETFAFFHFREKR
jgi:hypothetical protein